MNDVSREPEERSEELFVPDQLTRIEGNIAAVRVELGQIKTVLEGLLGVLQRFCK